MEQREFIIEVVNKDIKVKCREDQNALNAIERQSNGKFMVGCRFGGCGFCRVKVLEGTFTQLPMSASYVSEKDRKDNIVLACRIHPTSPLRLYYLGQYGTYE